MTKKKSYSVLGIDKSAGETEIKKAYRDLVLKYHPDRNKSEYASTRFQEIRAAYEALIEIDKKRESVTICPHCGEIIDVDVKHIETSATESAIENTTEKFRQANRKLTFFQVVVCIQIICTIVLSYYYLSLLNAEKNRNEVLLADLTSQRNDLQKQVISYESHIDMIREIASFLSEKSSGQASPQFYASEKILVISKSTKKTALQVTADFEIPYRLNWDYDKAVINITSQDNWDDTKLTVYIEPVDEGLNYVTFSNTKNDQTFRVLVIVTA